MSLAYMVTMFPLVKNRMVVPANAKKYQSQWTMGVLRGLNTNLLHLQLGRLWVGISMLGVPNASVNLHCSMTEIFGSVRERKCSTK